MKEGPDIAMIGALIGDPARANMLTALMSGKVLTASELAAEAGITPQTASSHLAKLEAANLTRQRKQGRHRYVSLASDDVGTVLEAMMWLAAKCGHVCARTGPADPALRKARVCYNHMAGELGVRLYDSLKSNGFMREDREEIDLTDSGAQFVRRFGIDLDALTALRRPLCLSCLDWSARRTHLAGALGTAMLDRIYEIGWARRDEGSRVINFTRKGEQEFLKLFTI